MSAAASDLLDTLSRRRTVISRLDDEALDKPALTDQVDVSRQTVNRALRELETIGVVERVNGNYRLTLFGRVALAEFESLLARYDRLCSMRDLLEYLPPDFEFDSEAFADAEITYADPPVPHEPIREFEELVEGARTVVGYSPVSFPQYVTVFHRQSTETDTDIELYLDAPLVRSLHREYETEFRETLAEPNFALYQLEETLCPNMGIAVFDETTVWVGVYDDSGNLRGTLITDADRAVRWARERLTECRALGRAVSLDSNEE